MTFVLVGFGLFVALLATLGGTRLLTRRLGQRAATIPWLTIGLAASAVVAAALGSLTA